MTRTVAELGEPDVRRARVDAFVDAVRALARWASRLRWADVDDASRDRFSLLLYDTLAVARAGAGLVEHRSLLACWPVTGGPATAFGHGSSPTERAAWLNGTASVALEMDSASRMTRGHAASQSFFAVLAAGEEVDAPAAEVLAGLLVAHEVASRFGRASTLASGLHPHGSWATAGAAAGAARILGLGADGIAQAVDASGGLLLSPPFAAATSGNLVRNHWVGFTNTAGLVAARMAHAYAGATLTAPAVDAYASALGELDVAVLAQSLDDGDGAGLALHTDFLKRHAACGYTHAVLDAVLLARSDPAWPADLAAVERFVVETNETSAELAGLRCDSRLAAMFSIDYLVAAAALLGDTGPAATDAGPRSDRAVLDLAGRVEVRVAPDLQARMPLDRGARVTVQLTGRPPIVVEVPNARWDPRHHPATWRDARDKARVLLGPLGVDEHALHDWVGEATRTDGLLPPLGPVLG